MTFDEQLDVILKHEGTYQAWVQDGGNYLHGKLIGTKFGITAPRLAQHRGVDTLTRNDMKRLELAEARDIYRKYYFDAAKISLLPGPIQAKVFDMCVNHGPAGGIRLLQSVLRQNGHKEVIVDGRIGPQTTRAAHEACDRLGPRTFVNQLVKRRNEFYEGIIRRRPSQERFRRGWLRRSNSFLNSAPLQWSEETEKIGQPGRPAVHPTPKTIDEEFLPQPRTDHYVEFIAAILKILEALVGAIRKFLGRPAKA